MSASHRETILVVDDDKVARRFLEATLTTAGGWRVEVAHDGASALEIVRTTPVDLILCDVRMPDLDGFQLLHRLQQETRLRDVPFMFISVDQRVTSKTHGFELGAHDYITKPFAISEVVARVGAALRRAHRVRRTLANRSYNLAGDFSGISFTDLVNQLHVGRRTGVLSVITARASGQLVVHDGALLHATFGTLEGEEAFYRFMLEERGHFEFEPRDVDPATVRVTIAASPTALLMDGARRLDELRRAGLSPAENQKEALAASARRAVVADDLVEGPAPALRLESELGDAIGGPFVLGQIEYFDEEGLYEWTLGDGRSTRFHSLLVADLGAGASAMASIASPLGGPQLVAGLRDAAKTLTLTFDLRGSCRVDVALLDDTRPAMWLNSLVRRPSCLVLAPTGGDWLSLSADAKVQIETLLRTLLPCSVLGIGNAGIDIALAETLERAGVAAPHACLHGTLGGTGIALRDAMVAALHTWARGAAADTSCTTRPPGRITATS